MPIHVHVYKYNCLKCDKSESILIRDTSISQGDKIWEKAFDKKICLSCYCKDHLH